ncbi:hypothetical protein Bca4012_063010 [Brassica carinata]
MSEVSRKMKIKVRRFARGDYESDLSKGASQLTTEVFFEVQLVFQGVKMRESIKSDLKGTFTLTRRLRFHKVERVVKLRMNSSKSQSKEPYLENSADCSFIQQISGIFGCNLIGTEQTFRFTGFIQAGIKSVWI